MHGDPFPEKGGFYRSDQFSFAKIGVPGIYARGGPSFAGRPAGWGEARVKEFETLHYHQPSDQYDASWDLAGAVDDLQLLLVAALRIASAPEMPSWKAGDEFYYVGTNGRAYSTRTKPHRAQQVLGTSAAAGYYFDGNPEVVFVWRLPGGNVRVERWTAPSGKNGPSRKVGDFAADLSAVF